MRALGGALRFVRQAVGLAVPDTVPAVRLDGTETVALGGGEMVATPGMAALPLDDRSLELGLDADSLALPPAGVRVLRDVEVNPAEGVVLHRRRTIVADSTPSERVFAASRPDERAPVTHHGSLIAPYGAPGASAGDALLESVPRVLLLQHPALRRYGPCTIVQYGPLAPVEAWLLARVETPRLRVEHLEFGGLVTADRVVVATPVSRAGAGAIPQWYDRWLARETEAVAAPGSHVPGGRLVVVHGAADPMWDHPLTAQLVDSLGFTVVDTSTGFLVDHDGTPHSPAAGTSGLVAALRDATVVVGATDASLAHAVLCRKAHLVQVGLSPTCTPRIAQMAISKQLGHEFRRPDAVVPAVRQIDIARA